MAVPLPPVVVTRCPLVVTLLEVSVISQEHFLIPRLQALSAVCVAAFSPGEYRGPLCAKKPVFAAFSAQDTLPSPRHSPQKS